MRYVWSEEDKTAEKHDAYIQQPEYRRPNKKLIQIIRLHFLLNFKKNDPMIRVHQKWKRLSEERTESP